MLITIAAQTTEGLGTGGKLLGSVGTGSVAIALTLLLILGVRGKGAIKLSPTGAFITGFIAPAAYVSAGQMWTVVPESGQALGESMAVGLSDAGLGDVRIAGIALLGTLLLLLIKVTPAGGAWGGLFLSSVFTVAGGIWATMPAILTSLTQSVIERLTA
jgi:hypothetical protein